MVTVPRMAVMSLSRTFTLPSTHSRYTEPAAAIRGCTVVSGVEGRRRQWVGSSRKGSAFLLLGLTEGEVGPGLKPLAPPLPSRSASTPASRRT